MTFDFIKVFPCQGHVVFASPARKADGKTGLQTILSMKLLATFCRSFACDLAPAFASLRVRVGAVWVQSPIVSFCVINLNVRPDPTCTPRARATPILICDWLEAVLSQFPARCTPIIAMGFNDDGCVAALLDVFGPCQGRLPKANATALAAKMVSHYLALVNTFRPHGPTFYGATSTSRINHIAVPTATLPRLRAAFVGHDAGGAFQLIVPKTRANASLTRRDHRPLAFFLASPCLMTTAPLRPNARKVCALITLQLLPALAISASPSSRLSRVGSRRSGVFSPTHPPTNATSVSSTWPIDIGELFFAQGARPCQLPAAR